MYVVFKLITGECLVVSDAQWDKINSRVSFRQKILWSIENINNLEYALTLSKESASIEEWEHA